jgi:hypothetical protein
MIQLQQEMKQTMAATVNDMKKDFEAFKVATSKEIKADVM